MDEDRRTRVGELLMVLAGLSVAAAPARALAQAPAAEGSAKAEDAPKAEALFNEGKKQYAAGKLQKAYEAYRAAWDLKQSYDIAANLANAEKLLGKSRDAAEHYAYSLRTFPATGKAEQQKRVEAKLAEVRKEVGAIAIQVSVPGAEVLVDERSVGSAPLAGEVFVDPGPHEVKARLPGYKEATRSVLAGKGSETIKVDLVLAESREIRGAVNGGAGQGGTSGGRATPGLGPSGKPRDAGFRPGPAWFITGGALAVVGLGAGVGLNVAANGASAQAHTLSAGKTNYACSPKLATVDTVCPELHDTLVRQSKLSDGALAGYVVGGAFALGTAGLGIWALTRPSAPPPKAVVMPTVGKNEAGLLFTGVW